MQKKSLLVADRISIVSLIVVVRLQAGAFVTLHVESIKIKIDDAPGQIEEGCQMAHQENASCALHSAAFTTYCYN